RLQKSTLTPNLTAFTSVDSQNLADVMVSVQFILAIGVFFKFTDLLIFGILEKSVKNGGF
ncbi:hypothetical protein ACXO4N_07150, partial [Lactobacillus delbrueckii subsp. bulgaricus]